MIQIFLEAKTPDAMLIIERAARTCHASIANSGTNPYFIQALLKLGHLSILEHVSVSFRVLGVSRALSHQLVRHRHLSFSQESQRHVEPKFYYVIPKSIEKDKKTKEIYKDCLKEIQAAYIHLIKLGVPKEDARFLLPNAIETKLYVTGNLRAWLEFFKQRLDKSAQWEIRDLSKALWLWLSHEYPDIFNKIVLGNIPVRDYDV